MIRTTFLYLFIASCAWSQPLLDRAVVKAFDSELSGESAKRNLEYVTRMHRIRGSSEFRKAIDFVESKLKEYGLEGVEVFQIPADGKSMYGTQKSRLVWEAEFAELWEMEKDGDKWKPKTRLADWESMPITLAEDSESGEATADLVDAGAGSSEKDYENIDVRGKIVLISSSPSAAVKLAVAKGAVGLVSYTQNQLTAWSREDQNLIRWGHFDSFDPIKTFCFMISLKQAREFQARLIRGERIVLHAKVKAGQHPGAYSFATAIIKGADPVLQNEEIAFTCHLDHQRPGANDNASGSMTILEIARSLSKLIAEGRISRPRRTIRFIWSPEIEGTLAILAQRPIYADRFKAVIHMDMVGGGPVTKSVFHVAGAPQSLPNFVADVGQTFGGYVNSQSDAYASGYAHDFKFVSNEGGKEPLQAVLGEFHMGSDHDVYNEGSFRIPCIYMHDWPDRYIHTNFDMAANIDPTKLKRAGFIGAVSGYYLSNLQAGDAASLWSMIRQQALKRTSQVVRMAGEIPKEEVDNLWSQHFLYERGVFQSLKSFVQVNPALEKEAGEFYSTMEKLTGKPSLGTRSNTASVIYKRNGAVKGPLSVFGYDYLVDHLGEEKVSALRLPGYHGLWGDEYAYETLNFVDGRRSTEEIRNAVSAEFGPIPLEMVEEYLRALESAGVIVRQK